jgi:hypothetical protein
MAIFYLDRENGNDAETSPLGWWKVAYTNGNGTAPAADEVVTGATSGSTAKLTVAVSPTSGSWAAGTAAGTMYFYGKSAAFVAETVNAAGGASFVIASDFTYCAWSKIQYGVLATRVSAGDTVRFLKSPPPVKLSCQATWTQHSNTITLDSALTATIDLCETNWTAGGFDVTCASETTEVKEGTRSQKFTFDSTPQANQRQAYRTLPSTLDLSSYQEISFQIFFRGTTGSGVANDGLSIALCSDSVGNTIVDEFLIPELIHNGGAWIALTLPRVGGGNLGSAINSIALYTKNNLTQLASKWLFIDDIIACTTNGLSLTSLISKNTLEKSVMDPGVGEDYGDEAWITIKSIVGTTVILQASCGERVSATGYSNYNYIGTTEKVDTYIRKTTKWILSTTNVANVETIQVAGTDGNRISFEFGFDRDTNLQSGVTYVDGMSDMGTWIFQSTRSFFNYNNFAVIRYNGVFNFSTASNLTIGFVPDLMVGGLMTSLVNTTNLVVENVINCSANIGGVAARSVVIERVKRIMNIFSALTVAGSNFLIKKIDFVYNIGYFIYSSSSGHYRINEIGSIDYVSASILNTTSNSGLLQIDKIHIESVNVTSIHNPGTLCFNYIIKKITGVEVPICYRAGENVDPSSSSLQIHDYNGTAYYYGEYYYVKSQIATAGGTGLEWLVTCKKGLSTSYLLSEDLAWKFPLARVLILTANKLVTVTCYFKKNDNTAMAAGLICEGFQIDGVDSDVKSLCPNDTNRNQLSISFTPTGTGVVEIAAYFFQNERTWEKEVIIDDIDVTIAP